MSDLYRSMECGVAVALAVAALLSILSSAHVIALCRLCSAGLLVMDEADCSSRITNHALTCLRSFCCAGFARLAYLFMDEAD
jgi:hypothetical protein